MIQSNISGHGKMAGCDPARCNLDFLTFRYTSRSGRSSGKSSSGMANSRYTSYHLRLSTFAKVQRVSLYIGGGDVCMSVSDSSSTTCLLLLRDTRGAILLESERTGTVSALNSPVAFKKESQDEKDMMIMAK